MKKGLTLALLLVVVLAPAVYAQAPQPPARPPGPPRGGQQAWPGGPPPQGQFPGGPPPQGQYPGGPEGFGPMPQPGRPHPGAGERMDPETQKLMETVMAARIAKELGLNDEQTVLMTRRIAEYKEQAAELKKQRQEMAKKLKAALNAKEPDDKIEAALNELVAQDGKVAEFKKTIYLKASEGLSVTQRARLYVFVNEFENDMRRLIQRARERGFDRMGPGGEPGQPGGPEGFRGRWRQNMQRQPRMGEPGPPPGQPGQPGPPGPPPDENARPQ